MTRRPWLIFLICCFCIASASAQQGPAAAGPASMAAKPSPDIMALVGRLNLERYKATIKGLTQFGDRRQGTDRNRAAVDWIEEQLKSYGCTNTERIRYEYQPSAGSGAPRPPADPNLDREERAAAVIAYRKA